MPGYADPLPQPERLPFDRLRIWLNGQTIDPTKIRAGALPNTTLGDLVPSDIDMDGNDISNIGLIDYDGIGTDVEIDSRTFTNTSFADIDALTGGAGAINAISTSITTGTRALVIVTARIINDGDAYTIVGWRVSGATTIASDDSRSLHCRGGAAAGINASAVFLATLTGGTNDFELQARVNGGTGTLTNPELIVIPI